MITGSVVRTVETSFEMEDSEFVGLCAKFEIARSLTPDESFADFAERALGDEGFKTDLLLTALSQREGGISGNVESDELECESWDVEDDE